MRIPMVDLVAQYRDLQPQLEPAFLSALHAAQFILGPNVQAFEKEAADYLGVAHAITCANGTDALHLALLAADIGPGDEVITTPFTFAATAETILLAGLEPAGVLELNHVFRQQGYRKDMGVKGAVAVLFNQRFIKSKKAATSNWANPRLSEAQLVYAANDAYAAARVHAALRLS